MPTKPSQSMAFSCVSASARTTRRLCDGERAEVLPGWSCTAIITFCRHDSRLNRRTSWNERTMPLRATWCGLRPTSSSPLSMTEPASGGMAPVSRLNTVVLPAPLGPTRAVIVPWRSSMSRSLAATMPPKRLLTPAVSQHDRRVVPGPLAAVLLGRRQLGVDVLGRRAATSSAAPTRRPSRRALRRRARRVSQRHSEKPSGRAPWGRRRISTAEGEAVDDQLDEAGPGGLDA